MKEYNYLSIRKIVASGIMFNDGYNLDFEECKNEWAKEKRKSKDSNICIGTRDIENDIPCFVFWGKEKIKVYFNHKGIFARKRNKKKFVEMQLEINRLGYSTYDLS